MPLTVRFEILTSQYNHLIVFISSTQQHSLTAARPQVTPYLPQEVLAALEAVARVVALAALVAVLQVRVQLRPVPPPLVELEIQLLKQAALREVASTLVVSLRVLLLQELSFCRAASSVLVTIVLRWLVPFSMPVPSSFGMLRIALCYYCHIS